MLHLWHICSTGVAHRNTGAAMGKAHISARLDDGILEALDAFAAREGITRTQAVERAVMALVQGPERAQEGAQEAHGADVPPADLRAVCEVLRASNADLRAEVSRLWAQVGEKDQQIQRAQELADHAQKLHAAEVQRALPAEGETTEGEAAGGIRSLIASIFGRKKGGE